MNGLENGIMDHITIEKPMAQGKTMGPIGNGVRPLTMCGRLSAANAIKRLTVTQR